MQCKIGDTLIMLKEHYKSHLIKNYAIDNKQYL